MQAVPTSNAIDPEFKSFWMWEGDLPGPMAGRGGEPGTGEVAFGLCIFNGLRGGVSRRQGDSFRPSRFPTAARLLLLSASLVCFFLLPETLQKIQQFDDSAGNY